VIVCAAPHVAPATGNPALNVDTRLFDTRTALARRWLSGLPADLGLRPTSLSAALDDGSFRRYFRLAGCVDGQDSTCILMDAPPPQEDCRPFAHVTGLLQAAGLNVPRILAADFEQGFMLLGDLGRSTYYQTLTTRQVDDVMLQTMYRQAIDALVQMQQAQTVGLPVYSAALMREELALFTQWYVPWCQTSLTAEQTAMLHALFAGLTQDNAAQPQVFVHRDFHSPNLMHVQHTVSGHHPGPNPGIIDYQDALLGPITYDVASLVMDARITWEEAQQLDWTIRYWQAARQAGLPVAADFAEFHRACDWMALQRNLRILGVFVRLSQRDGKSQYLTHLPRVMRYVRQVAGRYDRFRGLLRLLDKLENHQPKIAPVERCVAENRQA